MYNFNCILFLDVTTNFILQNRIRILLGEMGNIDRVYYVRKGDVIYKYASV